MNRDKLLVAIWAAIGTVLLVSHLTPRPNPEPVRVPVGYTATWEDETVPEETPILKASHVEDDAVICLATNIYHEARGEPLSGQAAVANVVMTRAKGDRSKICSVIMADKQFSWTLKRNLKVHNVDAFETALFIARKALNGKLKDHSKAADHYHADNVSPKFAKAKCMEKRTVIGRHIFYKCKHGRYKTL